MATRYYISNTAPTYTPTTKRGAWNLSASTITGKLGAKAGTATTTTAAGQALGGTWTELTGRWISGPLSAHTFTGEQVQWVLGEKTNNVTNSSTSRLAVHIFVTVGDSDTLRGTLLNTGIGGTNLTTTATGVSDSAISLGSVTSSNGDRIVVEIGWQKNGTATALRTNTLNYGGTGATDLASGSTTVTTNPGWIEFSGTLTDYVNTAPTITPDTADLSSFSTSTPTLAFTGSDAESDDLQYEVQIDTVNTFDSASAPATPALVQTAKVTNAASSPGTTSLTGITSGNLIVVDTVVTTNTVGIITGVTDSAGNAYTKRYDAGLAGVGGTHWYASNVTGGNLTFSVAFNATSTNMSAIIREYSGIATSPLDGTAHTATASSASPNSGNTTTTNANDLLLGQVVDIGGTGQTYTAGTGYGNLDSIKNATSGNVMIEDRIVSATGSYAATATIGTSGNWMAGVAAYMAGTTGGPLLDKLSASDAGFLDVPNNADTQPFTAGNQVSYTVQSALSDGTYYWRARTIDPLGSDTYSSWTTTRSFTVGTVPATNTTNFFKMF